jgi:hypothetical protein
MFKIASTLAKLLYFYALQHQLIVAADELKDSVEEKSSREWAHSHH